MATPAGPRPLAYATDLEWGVLAAYDHLYDAGDERFATHPVAFWNTTIAPYPLLADALVSALSTIAVSIVERIGHRFRAMLQTHAEFSLTEREIVLARTLIAMLFATVTLIDEASEDILGNPAFSPAGVEPPAILLAPHSDHAAASGGDRPSAPASSTPVPDGARSLTAPDIVAAAELLLRRSRPES